MRTLIVLAALLLAACSNLAYENARGAGAAGSTARTAPTRGAVPETYVVRSGDTLYSIAFRYGLDQRELARWNGLGNPNRIAAGQRLTLRDPGGGRTTTAAAASGGSRPAGPTTSAPSRSTAAAPRPAAARPDWLWPTAGGLVARFGERGLLSTGIGIGGVLGQDVVAAAAGRIVYSGSGLPDYGQLVIIEHNETWLSAYGHNRQVLVSQGQTVARGQKIAEMGTGPGGSPRLHFEIRQNGEPRDPAGLLPARP